MPGIDVRRRIALFCLASNTNSAFYAPIFLSSIRAETGSHQLQTCPNVAAVMRPAGEELPK